MRDYLKEVVDDMKEKHLDKRINTILSDVGKVKVYVRNIEARLDDIDRRLDGGVGDDGDPPPAVMAFWAYGIDAHRFREGFGKDDTERIGLFDVGPVLAGGRDYANELANAVIERVADRMGEDFSDSIHWNLVEAEVDSLPQVARIDDLADRIIGGIRRLDQGKRRSE